MGDLSMERVILPDCCEDWILAYGAFYKEGSEFDCIECGSPWRKLESGKYQSRTSGQTWSMRTHEAEDQQFHYLSAEGGQKAMVERCCARILLSFGERIKLGRQFNCPLCGSTWKKDALPHRSGLQVTAYTNQTTGVSIAIQAGKGRDFLVPVDEYQPQRFE